MNTLHKYINKHIPKRRTGTGGHRITFEAKLAKKTWIMNVSNDTNSHDDIVTAIKKGTKGTTDTTFKQFNFKKEDLGFEPTDDLPMITKL